MTCTEYDEVQSATRGYKSWMWDTLSGNLREDFFEWFLSWEPVKNNLELAKWKLG